RPRRGRRPRRWGGGPVNAIHKALVRRMRQEVADDLARRLREDEEGGRLRMSLADQRVYGRQLINRRLESYAKEQLDAGREPLSHEDEMVIAQAIQDALFGLGALQRLLEDETIE